MDLAHVFVLSLRHRRHHGDGRQDGVADAPCQNLVSTRWSIEIPLRSIVFLDRNRKWSVVSPEV